MQEEKLYLVFTDTGTVLSEAIKRFTKKPYNHASIAFDSSLKEVYSFGRKKPHNPFNGGFVREDMHSFIFLDSNCAVYSLTVSKEQKIHMKQMISDIEKEKDLYRYNFIGLFGALLEKEIPRQHAFFCSQFVSMVLQDSGALMFDKPYCFIAPHDIQSAAGLTLEYEGDMMTYLLDDSLRDTPLFPNWSLALETV